MISRGRVLFSGVALGVLGLPALSAFVEAASAASPDDIAILNAGIELERAAVKAYSDAAGTGLLSAHVGAVAEGFKRDHEAHLGALTAAVQAAGGVASTKAVAIPYPPLKTEKDILNFARSVEEKAASTYLSVVPELNDRNLAKVAASILGIETTHVTLLAAALNDLPAYPGAFVR